MSKVFVVDFSTSFFWRPHATPTKKVAGTVAFVSPEATGLVHHPIDPRSDVYSLGCTFFYLLTGHSIFSESSNMVRSHISQTAPDVRTYNSGVPE